MRQPVVFMFAGQGSQYYHMGKELYCRNSIFRHWMSKLDDIIYEKIGFSIIDKIYNEEKNKGDRFDRLLWTHSAIFMLQYSLARLLIEIGIEPDYVLGASLGEVVSAAIAEVISLEEALGLLLKQAELIESRCKSGSMIAIIDSPELYNQSSAIFQCSELAAINYSSHFIVSGDGEKLLKLQEYLINNDIVFQTLPVKYGFHSSNIMPIESDYKSLLCKISFNNAEIQVIACSLNDCVTRFSATYFWDVIRQPIYFQKTILKLEKQGQFNYIDLGPSGTLANFVRRNLSKNSLSQVYDLLTAFGQDVKKLEKVKEHFC